MRRMELVQLEHFLAVVEERSFTRASVRVGRTQPAVSQSIKKLEEEVGTPLFARDVHDVSLTEAGRIFAEHARRMLRERDDARRDLRTLKTTNSGTVNIAAHESAAVYLLPGALGRFVTRFPNVKIGIYRSPLTDIPRQVMDREVHVGYVQEEPGAGELASVEVHMDEMVLIAPTSHRLAGRAHVRINDLGRERFVIHHACNSTEQRILRLFQEHRTPCHIATELWSFETIKAFVQAGVGIGIVPRITVRQELRDRTLAAIPVSELSMPCRTLMIYRNQADLAGPALALINMIRTFTWPRVSAVGVRRRA
jgi:DNA-binding transcriptional LysR family regulator